jgi:hypothetical protein
VKILYLCALTPEFPCSAARGALFHVREIATAFRRAGHDVVLAAVDLSHSPREEPATLGVPLSQPPPGAETVAATLRIKAYAETPGVANSFPGELHTTIYNRELQTQLRQPLEYSAPDFIYERASLYATAGARATAAAQRRSLVKTT